jgi:molybdate transport system ATP-binding protein
MTLDVMLNATRGDFVLDAAFSAPEQGVTAIFGPSGCGKTTLLRAIAGLEPGAAGHLKVGDEIWQDDERFLPTHERPLGYVFQEPSLFSHLSVRENLEYGYRRLPKTERRVEPEEAIRLLGLGKLLGRDPEDLSGGERQRVAIARALLTSPSLLLLDEPLTGLDRESKAEILPYLEALHRQLDIPVLYISHSHDEVARLADHLVLLEDGRTVASGPIGEMLTRLDLPAFRGDEAEAVIEARVVEHDDHYELTHLEFPGGRFQVARTDLAIGTQARLRILARDVSLTLERQTETSILNILPVTVEDLADTTSPQVLVRVSASGTPLLARVTRKSAEALALGPGKRVYAQVKTVALLS